MTSFPASVSAVPRWRLIGRDLTAAAVVSLAAIAFYLSTATLLFQGPLAVHVPLAVGLTLLGAAVLSLVAAFRGSLPLASVGPEPATVPVMAAITGAVAAQANPDALLSTTLVALLLTGAAIGVVWWLTGRYRGGDVIRFIPYPVIGGFLGSIGWLMLTGGLGVSTGQTFSFAQLLGWLSGPFEARLWAGVVIGVLIWRATLRFTHVLTLPALVLGAALLVHLGLWQWGIGLADARSQGWLLPPFSQTLPVWPWRGALLQAVQWDVVVQQAGLMVSAVIVATLGLLLSDTSLEVAWETRADINQDLRALGAGNVLVAALGGLSGGVSISRSVLNRSAGAAGRASGALKAMFCLGAMVGGGSLIALVPRPLLGGLLIYLGLGMFKAWIVDSRKRLPWSDYAVVLGMVGVTATLGFVAAVCLGVLACCLDFAVSSARVSPVRRLMSRSAWPSRVERSAADTERLLTQGERMTIVELQGVLFFGSATRLMRQTQQLIEQADRPQLLLLDFQRVRWIDSSASQVLVRLVKAASQAGTQVALSGVGAEVKPTLLAAGCLVPGGPAQHSDIHDAVAAWDEAVLRSAEPAPDASEFETWLARTLQSPDAVRRVMDGFETLTLQAGEHLFAQGDPSDALYLVRSGRLSAYVHAQGKELVVRSILPGGAIGEMGLFRGAARSASVRAEVASDVLCLGRDALARIEAEQPALAAAFYRVFLQQLAGRIDQLTAQAQVLSA